MKIQADDLLGAMVNFNGFTHIIETIEEAKEVKVSIENATDVREIIDDEEFEMATRRLNLEGHEPKKIISYIFGREFLICLSGDWY